MECMTIQLNFFGEAAPPKLASASVLTSRVLWLCRKCEGHDDAIRVLAVAGGNVFSGSYDGTIGVW